MSIKVTANIPDFKRQLAELDKKFRQRVVRSALRAAGTVLVKSAQKNAPKLDRAISTPKTFRMPGALAAAIYTARGRAGRDRLRFYVSVHRGKKYATRGWGDPFYWRFLEAGWIPRGPGKKLKGGTRRRALYRARLKKAGAKEISFPFFKPAFEKDGDRALSVFNQRMAKGIAALRSIK